VRRTKIIATIGPSTCSDERLDELVSAGMDVARLNASHSRPDELDVRVKAVRSAAERAGRHVAIMLDLAGPKVRMGIVAKDTVLSAGQSFILFAEERPGDASGASVTYQGLAQDLRPGDRILVDDGRIELSVESISGGDVYTRVVTGGTLVSRKGVNVPGVTLSVDPITSYDEEVLRFGLKAQVDYVAQSFVRSAEDIVRLRRLMGDETVPIVAKVEKHEAMGHIDEIVEVSDAVMVARGDLGVETSPEQVPVFQRKIIEVCRDRSTPVIVATQMLESMILAPRPTRAEASDVANAIFSRVDAVMLSAETAVGAYPAESVETMATIAMTAEASLGPSRPRHAGEATTDVTRAVSTAVRELAEELKVVAIVTATQSGSTARAVAGHRPLVPIIAVTPFAQVARRLALVWGVTPVVLPLAEETTQMLIAIDEMLLRTGVAKPGDRVAVTAGIASRSAGATDFVVVRTV